MIVLVINNLKFILINVNIFKLANKKFYISDNRLGTGLFIKVKNKLMIKQDIIVSFCSTHMIIQLDPISNKLITQIKNILNLNFYKVLMQVRNLFSTQISKSQ